MGKGAEDVIEVGSMRAEKHQFERGIVWELMARQGGGYRLTLFGRRDRQILREILDSIDERESYVLVLGEGYPT